MNGAHPPSCTCIECHLTVYRPGPPSPGQLRARKRAAVRIAAVVRDMTARRLAAAEDEYHYQLDVAHGRIRRPLNTRAEGVADARTWPSEPREKKVRLRA